MATAPPLIDHESAVYAIVLGRLLATMRERRNWKQEHVAGLTSLTQSAISRIERGTSMPDAYAFRRLAEAFGMTAPELNSAVEAAMARSEQACRSTIHPPKGAQWWETALKVAGVIGLTGLIAFAVAAALEEDDRKDE